MAQKVSQKYTLNIQGVVDVNNDHITVIVEDRGEFDLAMLMNGFNGKECKISVNYDEDYESPEVNEETGEVI